MRSTCFGACAGAIIFGVSVSVLAQPPQGKGKPADAGRSSFVQFPVPRNSVGVLHAASVAQAQRPAPPPPSMSAPASASNGIGHAFGKSDGNGHGLGGGAPGNGGGNAFGVTGNGPGKDNTAGSSIGLAIGQLDKTAVTPIAFAAGAEKEATGDTDRGVGSLYSLQAVLPVAPGGFPSIQASVPIPECFAR